MTGPSDGAGNLSGGVRAKELLVACVGAASVDGAGLSLTRGRSHEPVFGTDATAEGLELAQFTLGEGPCVDATAFGVPVLVPDLEDLRDGHGGRWPVFASEALALGVRAIYALPLRIGVVAIGAVDLYRRESASLEGEQLSRALTAVDAVAVTLLDDRGVVGAKDSDPFPLRSLEVHRAAGMVMVQLGVSIEKALIRLRATAFAEGLPVEALASEVVKGHRRFEEVP